MNINICGGAPSVTKKKPKNWIDSGYSIVVPYKFKWRTRVGKAKCDCKNMQETYQPWYGFTFYHEDACAIIKHIELYPGIKNFFFETDLKIIARSE